MTIRFEISISEPVLVRIDKLIDALGGMTAADGEAIRKRLQEQHEKLSGIAAEPKS